MKMTAAKFKNFGAFENFECKFHDEVTHLVGLNGAGKTTVGLHGLMAAINGIAESSANGKLMGERFRFIGKAGASADVSYQFSDNGTTFWIKNHITKASNSITIKMDGDNPVNEDWLKGFLNVALMSAKNFCALNGREQAKVLGIDTASFDNELKGYKDEFTLLNRDLKSFGDLIEPIKIEYIDKKELLSKKETIRKKLNDLYLSNVAENKSRRAKWQTDCEKLRCEVLEFNSLQTANDAKIKSACAILNELIEVGYNGKEVSVWIESLPKPQANRTAYIPEPEYVAPELPDSSALMECERAIEEADLQNEHAQEWITWSVKCQAKISKEKEIEANKAKQAECIKMRADYMAGQKFGFDGLTTDESGCLLLNDRPLTDVYFSKGQLEVIVAKLHASINPIFKCRFIDDLDLIDEKHQEQLLKDLLEAGFQVITSEVGEKSDKENCIILRECKIVDPNAEEGKKLL